MLWRHVRLNVGVMLKLLRVSLTGILQFAIANTSWIVLVRIVSIFGASAVAGYTIAIRIVVFFILPAWGLSNAAATLVGQNLGAKRPDRAAQAVWRTSVYNVIFLGVLGVFFVVFATPVVRLFVHDPAVVPIAATALRTFSCGNMGYAYVHGDAAGIQRSGRHADADDCELLRLLGAGVAAGVVAGCGHAYGCERRICVGCDCRMLDRDSQHCPVSAREVGTAADLAGMRGECG